MEDHLSHVDLFNHFMCEHVQILSTNSNKWERVHKTCMLFFVRMYLIIGRSFEPCWFISIILYTSMTTYRLRIPINSMGFKIWIVSFMRGYLIIGRLFDPDWFFNTFMCDYVQLLSKYPNKCECIQNMNDVLCENVPWLLEDHLRHIDF